MEEIIIPNCKEIELTTMDTVDTFASLAEALAVPVTDRKDERFLAVSINVLKRLSKKTKDVGRLFDTLENVTMAMVSERLTTADEWTPSTRGSLQKLTRLQEQALNYSINTIDDDFKWDIESKTNEIRKMIKEHKTKLEKCRTAQLDCWKAEGKMKQAQITLLTAKQSREKSGNLSLKQQHLRDRTIAKLEDKVSRKQKYLHDANFSYEKYVGDELTFRERLKQLSKGLVCDIRYSIKERVSYGMECLETVIQENLKGERRDECLSLIHDVNIKDKVATCLMRTTSKKYVCPDIKEYNVNYGMKSLLPAGLVVDASDVVEIQDRDIWKQPSFTSMAVDNNQNHNTGLTQRNTETPLLTFVDVTEDSQKVDVSTCTSLMQKPKPNLTVTALIEKKNALPGLLKLKKGMKIKQKITMDDYDLAFGCYRPGLFSAKVWGFFHQSETR